MRHLAAFISARFRPAASAQDASSAAEIRDAFFSYSGSVPKKEVGLRLSRRGFAEDSVNFWDGPRRTKKRVYYLKFDGQSPALVELR